MEEKYQHKQVNTKYGFSVDEKLKDLIELLIENGFDTNNSCQEQTHLNNVTWISFNGEVVHGLMKEVFKKNIKFYDYLSNATWKIVFDLDHIYDGENSISLRFPSEDLLYVNKCFREIFKKYLYDSKMEIIDMSTYDRKHMFEQFIDYQLPIFSLTCQLDITDFVKVVKTNKLSFFGSMCFLISHVCNEIKEFRQRIIDKKLVEFDVVHPGFALLEQNKLSFSSLRYSDKFDDFHDCYKNVSDKFDDFHDCYKNVPEIHSESIDKTNLIFIMSNHWTNFTSFTHPYDSEKNGSVPIITIGKFYEHDKCKQISIAIQVHHGIMDGFHVGQFYDKLQNKLFNWAPNTS